MVQRDQWDTYWAPKIVSRRGGGRGHRAAAPVYSCQSLPKRSPWGRLGSVLYTCNRLRRMRGRFDRWIHISTCCPAEPSDQEIQYASACTLVLPVKVAFVSVIGQRLDGTSGSREGMFLGRFGRRVVGRRRRRAPSSVLHLVIIIWTDRPVRGGGSKGVEI